MALVLTGCGLESSIIRGPTHGMSLNATMYAKLTASTPGKAATLSESCEMNCRPRASLYPLWPRSNDTVTTFAGSNPGSIACNARKLFTHKPAPINTTSDKATCVTTSRLRRLKRRATRPNPGVSSLRAATKSCLEATSAGARPKTIPVTSEGPWDIVGLLLESQQQAREPVCYQQAGGAAQASQYRAFSQQLPHDAPTA